MVNTLGRLVAALLAIISSSTALEVAGAASIVVGATMFSARAGWIAAGVLLLLKAADLDLSRGAE